MTAMKLIMLLVLAASLGSCVVKRTTPQEQMLIKEQAEINQLP